MIILILLSCFNIMVSAVPVGPNVLPTVFSQGGVTEAQRVVEATNQLSDAQTPAPLVPNVEQPQPGVPQQPGPQGAHQFLLPTQYYTWSPLGSPMIIPLQPSVYGSQPANQPPLPQQPLIFPPYRYFPLFSSPYSNQLASPYGFPMIPQSPLPQTPASQPPNSPVLPAETLSGAGPLGDAPQPVQQQQQQQQQQQNPRIVYMLQQPQSSPIGSLSSEELQMAAKMSQLGVYLTMLTNSPAGAVQPVNEATGLANPDQQGIAPTVGTSSVAGPQTQGPASSGQQQNTNGVPVGLERAAQDAATVQTPAQPKLQPTQGNSV